MHLEEEGQALRADLSQLQETHQQLFLDHGHLSDAYQTLQGQKERLELNMTQLPGQLAVAQCQLSSLRSEHQAVAQAARMVIGSTLQELQADWQALCQAVAVKDSMLKACSHGRHEALSELATVQEQFSLFRHTKQEDVDHLTRDLQVRM